MHVKHKDQQSGTSGRGEYDEEQNTQEASAILVMLYF